MNPQPHLRRLCLSLILLAFAGCAAAPEPPQRVHLRPGDWVDYFRLASIGEDGALKFHSDASDYGLQPPISVRQGQSFGMERESKRRTVFTYTVEEVDQDAQQVTLMRKVRGHR